MYLAHSIFVSFQLIYKDFHQNGQVEAGFTTDTHNANCSDMDVEGEGNYIRQSSRLSLLEREVLQVKFSDFSCPSVCGQPLL